MEKTNQKSNIERTFGPITIDNVGPSLNPKKHQAQLRQIVTSQYPGARGANSLSDALFSDNSFGVGEAYDEIRVTWIPVPIGSTIEDVQEKLAKHPSARLQKTLSLLPILSDEQKQAMNSGISGKTIEDYIEKFVVDPTDAPVLYKNHKQYRHISFRTTAVEDVDQREEDLKDMMAISMTRNAGVEAKKEAF